jgi:hypothetical protein
MAMRNYRQAKRSREAAQKARQKLKLERKLKRDTVPAEAADAAPASPEKGQEDVP